MFVPCQENKRQMLISGLRNPEIALFGRRVPPQMCVWGGAIDFLSNNANNPSEEDGYMRMESEPSQAHGQGCGRAAIARKGDRPVWCGLLNRAHNPVAT